MLDFELMGATPGTAAAPTASAPKSGYASTYYPGTVNPAEAQRVTLASGQELTGADFPLIAVRLARVTGIVLNSEGRPAEGALVTLAPSTRDLGLSLNMPSARTARNGTFVMNNVPPGDYTVAVEMRADPTLQRLGLPTWSAPKGPIRSAAVPLVVAAAK